MRGKISGTVEYFNKNTTEAAPLTVADSVRGMRAVLAQVTPADRARLLHHDGRRATHW